MRTKVMLIAAFLLASVAVSAGYLLAGEIGDATHVVYRAGSQGSFEGPEKYFTGKVHVDMHFPANETAHYSGATVTFEPKARSAWHLHPAGQHMLVTAGVGRTQVWGGPIVEIRKGDVVWCPPGVKHWHGAAPNQSMTHLVITGTKDGKNVEWLEKVTDEQYFGHKPKPKTESSMDNDTALNKQQQAIIPIAAFTASGDLEKLKVALNDGLDSGLTVNEVKEILVHLYAYAGFPRSLNALGTLMAVVDARKAKGIEDNAGKEASPLPADLDRDAYGAKVRAGLSGLDEVPPPAPWQLFTPIVDTFLKEHLFADLFARDVLSHQQRELTTIAALANMSGTESQLAYHLSAAMNTGLSEAQVHAFISVLQAKVGEAEAESARKIFAAVLAAKK